MMDDKDRGRNKKREDETMKDFKEKTAVITGAASGIGRALAQRCAREGMKVVLADIDGEALERMGKEIGAAESEVLTAAIDVSKAEDVQRLAQKTVDAFGQVHLLFNNAGVCAGGSLWEGSLDDREWIMDVNLWGVLHGLCAFIPIMLEQDASHHIVNTSSMAGLEVYHPSAMYHLTKHAVVAISEQLYHDFEKRGARIRVSVLCPGFVDTNILDSERHRPAGARPALSPEEDSKRSAIMEDLRRIIKEGMPPERVADLVFEGVENEQLYIFTHSYFKTVVQGRTEHILQAQGGVEA